MAKFVTALTYLARPIRESCGTFLLDSSRMMDFPLLLLSVMPILTPASTSMSGISIWVVKTFLFLLYFMVAVASVGSSPKGESGKIIAWLLMYATLQILKKQLWQDNSTLRCSYLQLSGQTSKNQPSGDHPFLHWGVCRRWWLWTRTPLLRAWCPRQTYGEKNKI